MSEKKSFFSGLFGGKKDGCCNMEITEEAPKKKGGCCDMKIVEADAKDSGESKTGTDEKKSK